MKSPSVLSKMSSTSEQPYGDAVILFDFDGQPKLGTRPIRPGGDFIFTTPDFPVTEPLTLIGQTPFKNDVIETNTPLRIVDDIDPDLNPYEFIVEYKGFQQHVFVKLSDNGVDAAELHWHTGGGQEPNWRIVLRMTGPEEKVLLIKELTPKSPFYDYEFLVFNQVTKQDIPVEKTPFGGEVLVTSGYFTTVVHPPGQDPYSPNHTEEVGGTDAADLIISPGG